MKLKIFYIVLVILLGSCGCTLKNAEPTEIPELPSDNIIIDPVPEADEETIYSEANYENDVFHVPGNIFICDGWIYYSINNNNYSSNRNIFRKCKLDLTQEETLFSTELRDTYYHPRFSINPDGYLISNEVDSTCDPTERELFIYCVHDGNLEKGILRSTDIYGGIVLYKDKIIMGLRERGPDQQTKINIYDREGVYEKTVCEGQIISFGVIDDSIYYWPMQFNETEMPTSVQSIMCYNMKIGTTEKALDVSMSEQILEHYPNSIPSVRFNGRNIISETDFSSYVYSSIDNIDPLRISFSDYRKDDSEVDSIEAEFIPSYDEDLYFIVRYYGATEEDYLFSEYYKVLHGMTDPVMLNELTSDVGDYFADGHMYYFRNGTLNREKYTCGVV